MLQQVPYKNLLLLTEDFDIELVYVKLGTISGCHCTEMMIVWSPLIGPLLQYGGGRFLGWYTVKNMVTWANEPSP